MNPDIQRGLVSKPLPVNNVGQASPDQATTLSQTAIHAQVVWCPGDVSVPTPGNNGCSRAFSTLSDLLAELAAKNTATAGTIWIGKHCKSATAEDGNLLFDGQTLTKMAEYDLTILGGWNGLGKGTLDPNSPFTLDGVCLHILHWKGNVSLRNIRVQNVTTGGGAGAVCVGTEGNIQLDRVLAHKNNLNGVTLDNTASASSSPASVTVGNCQFSENYVGLMVGTKGAVTLTNVLAQENAQRGAFVDNTYGAGDVLLKGTNTFLSNGSHGLEVDSNGQVSANHLVAYANGLTTSANGVYIMAEKAVTFGGSGKFKGNGGNGLEVSSHGQITAQNLTAVTNGGNGLWLTTTVLVAADAEAVTLNAVNADGNSHSGIVLYVNGKVLLSCSSVYDNANNGLYVRGATNTSGPVAGLGLQGFLAYLNGTNEDILSATPVARPSCP